MIPYALNKIPTIPLHGVYLGTLSICTATTQGSWKTYRKKIVSSLYEKHFSSDLQQMALSQETAAGQMEVEKKNPLARKLCP